MIRRIAQLAFATAVLFTWGCAGMTDHRAMFDDIQRRYTNCMRWTEFARAGAFVAPDAREEFRARTGSLGNLRFTDFEIEEMDTSLDSATVRVQYVGYRPTSPIVVTYVEEQHWQRTGDEWMVRPVLEERTQ